MLHELVLVSIAPIETNKHWVTMHQNKITICLGAVDENRTRLSRIDNPLPSQRTTVAYWYRVRESNPSLWLEGPRTYPEVQRDIIKQDSISFSPFESWLRFAVSILNLVPRTRIELVMTGYQPIVIPFNYPGIIWWSLMESNHLPPPHLIMATGLQPAMGNKLQICHTLFRMCRIKQAG